jgi:hypothetical protein
LEHLPTQYSGCGHSPHSAVVVEDFVDVDGIAEVLIEQGEMILHCPFSQVA